VTDDAAALLGQPFLDHLPVLVAAEANGEIRAGPPALPYNLAVYSFIETRLFSKLLFAYLDETSYMELQRHLIASPLAGDLVRGSGGVRKLRWGIPGRGKRGGVRIIYYARTTEGQIWLLTIYKKSEESTIPGHVLRQIKEEIDEL